MTALLLSVTAINGIACDSTHSGDREKDNGNNSDTTDITPPVISGITISDITGTTATISWTTDEPATGNIDFGINTSYSSPAPASKDVTADTISHSVAINGLNPNMTYHFKVRSEDAEGNEAISAGLTFKSAKAPPSYLFVIDEDVLKDAEKVMVQGLQGLLIQDASAENIWVDVPGGYEYWRDDLEASYGVVLDRSFENDPQGLLDHFKSTLSGYVLYDLGDDSENVATTLAGLLGLLPADTSLIEECQQLGLTMVMDVRGKDESWCLDHYGNLINLGVVVHQREDIHGCLRDYAVATKAFTFYDGNTPFMRSVFDRMNEGGMVLGWGRGEEFPDGEWQFVEPASERGLITVPSDWAHNLSVLSQFEPGDISQKNDTAGITAERNVHYVTFIMSDGDNLQWQLNDFTTDEKWNGNDYRGDFPLERWYGSDKRGDFPMGWTISPSMADLCPTVMKWYYEQATSNDCFISGVSGRGYFYPSMFPDLDAEASRMNDSLREADLHAVYILDSKCYQFSEEYLEPYAAQPEVMGGFWACYADYKGREGEIIFVDGKPFASVRLELWVKGETDIKDITQEKRKAKAFEIAESINALPADSHDLSGYTVVNIHPWSMSLADVNEVIEELKKNPNVRVVSPEVFLQLLKENAQYFGLS